ncbi:MAG: hypothetical protein ACRDPF_00540 [Streptosporangiaceae bacterium]
MVRANGSSPRWAADGQPGGRSRPGRRGQDQAADHVPRLAERGEHLVQGLGEQGQPASSQSARPREPPSAWNRVMSVTYRRGSHPAAGDLHEVAPGRHRQFELKDRAAVTAQLKADGSRHYGSNVAGTAQIARWFLRLSSVPGQHGAQRV